MPDKAALGTVVIEGVPLGPWLDALNQRIREHIGRDARNLQIGHAYLIDGGKAINDFAHLARVLQDDIVPLLEEYCYEDYDTLEKILGRALVDTASQRIKHELFEPARQAELAAALLAISPDLATSIVATSAQSELSPEDIDQTTGADEQ